MKPITSRQFKPVETTGPMADAFHTTLAALSKVQLDLGPEPTEQFSRAMTEVSVAVTNCMDLIADTIDHDCPESVHRAGLEAAALRSYLGQWFSIAGAAEGFYGGVTEETKGEQDEATSKD